MPARGSQGACTPARHRPRRTAEHNTAKTQRRKNTHHDHAAVHISASRWVARENNILPPSFSRGLACPEFGSTVRCGPRRNRRRSALRVAVNVRLPRAATVFNGCHEARQVTSHGWYPSCFAFLPSPIPSLLTALHKTSCACFRSTNLLLFFYILSCLAPPKWMST